MPSGQRIKKSPGLAICPSVSRELLATWWNIKFVTAMADGAQVSATPWINSGKHKQGCVH